MYSYVYITDALLVAASSLGIAAAASQMAVECYSCFCIQLASIPQMHRGAPSGHVYLCAGESVLYIVERPKNCQRSECLHVHVRWLPTCPVYLSASMVQRCIIILFVFFANSYSNLYSTASYFQITMVSA